MGTSATSERKRPSGKAKQALMPMRQANSRTPKDGGRGGGEAKGRREAERRGEEAEKRGKEEKEKGRDALEQSARGQAAKSKTGR